ncbi:hypothetical protein [Halomonas organivorans]|uniref:Uncharacterized protein n=1 Tax=Halomonas organivorans TaxID=257772 RepID=A0A7W5G6Y3_9GAMM|nr:hypothetical protein [Halomonas organivorans]MBB3142669.1 hypothetical protein [Halomonas organivorans]
MIDIKTLTLLPQDELLQASTLEIEAGRRYRQLALSFLPYDADRSQRMTQLGIACEHRIDALKWAAESLGLGACVALPEALADRQGESNQGGGFFIVDDATAELVWQEALEAALEDQRFARRLLAVNGTPELERPLLEYARQKAAECDVLMACHAGHARQA